MPRTVVRAVLLLVWAALAVWLIVHFTQDEAPDVVAEQEEAPGAARRAITSALTGAPDVLPEMANAQPPFRYPSQLYAQRVQGNVTLRLFVDSTGRVVNDSTRIEEPSGHAQLDSAAVRGAPDLRFKPARRRGSPIAVTLLYPVYFRHPEAPPLPGDTIL